MTATLPPLPVLAPEHRHVGADPSLLEAEIKQLVQRHIDDHPRSQQKRIGPSEIGTPCTRKLAYKLAGVPEKPRPGGWRPTVGTAVHSWLEEALMAENERYRAEHGITRWLIESKLHVGDILGENITGHGDAYDRVTATVVDWKIVGATTLRSAKAKGPKVTYRVQAHAYGRGYVLRGLPVERVAIAYLPSAGELSDAVFWSEPYNEQIVLDALTRANGVAAAVRYLGADEAIRQAPTADDYCTYCPWFGGVTAASTQGCPGDTARPARTDSVASLIA